MVPALAFAEDDLDGESASAQGEVDCSIPAASLEEMTDEAEEGLDARAVAGATNYTFTGFVYNQTETRTMLNQVNQFRAGNAWYWNSDNATKSYAGNLPALAIDKNLEQAAIQRAAELAIFYSHTRPNGTSCFTVNGSVYGENIAAGYRTV